MPKFVVGRLLGAIPLLLGVSLLVFTLLHVAPGSPERLLLGGHPASPQALSAIREEFHLNQPFFAQYLWWLGRVLRGNFGQTIVFHDTVWHLVAARILPTAELAAYALVFVLLFGLGLGTIAAMRRGRAAGNAAAGLMLGASAMSPYISSVLLITVFAVGLGWFPILGLGGGGLDRVYHLTLPALALGLGVMSLLGRTMQASLSEVRDETYVEAARSRGYSEWRVLTRHTLRNALLPVLTIAGVSFGYLIVGAVLVEYTFGLGGLGSLLVQAVDDKDYPTVQAVTLLFAVAFVMINLFIDVLYAALDPRVRLSTRGQ